VWVPAPVVVLMPSICMHIPVPYHADNDIERAHAVGTAVTTRWLRSLVCTHTRDYRGVRNLATRDRPSIVLHRITLSVPTCAFSACILFSLFHFERIEVKYYASLSRLAHIFYSFCSTEAGHEEKEGQLFDANHIYCRDG
jgi:hypothetical protein